MQKWIPRRVPVTALLALAVTATSAVIARRLMASDHQDTPLVEMSPRFDVNDVYAFPSPTDASKTVLVLGTSSPITPAQTPSFTFGNKDQELYQLKIDNTGDAVEDLVFQITFDEGVGAAQKYTIRGPVAPSLTGTKATLLTTGTTVTGNVGSIAGSSSGVQTFAGLKADPFVVDLEQFFAILPDRRPSTGPLALPLTATASAFRNPGVDFLKPFNALAIAIELPKAMLQPSTDAAAKFGVWGTISR